jgi:hypothetical protein
MYDIQRLLRSIANEWSSNDWDLLAGFGPGVAVYVHCFDLVWDRHVDCCLSIESKWYLNIRRNCSYQKKSKSNRKETIDV